MIVSSYSDRRLMAGYDEMVVIAILRRQRVCPAECAKVAKSRTDEVHFGLNRREKLAVS